MIYSTTVLSVFAVAFMTISLFILNLNRVAGRLRGDPYLVSVIYILRRVLSGR